MRYAEKYISGNGQIEFDCRGTSSAVISVSGTFSRPLEAMILPGRSVGYVINGAGANLNNAARISMTLEWYEEIAN